MRERKVLSLSIIILIAIISLTIASNHIIRLNNTPNYQINQTFTQESIETLSISGDGTSSNPYVLENILFIDNIYENIHNVIFDNCEFKSYNLDTINHLFSNCINIIIRSSKIQQLYFINSELFHIYNNTITNKFLVDNNENIILENNTFQKELIQPHNSASLSIHHSNNIIVYNNVFYGDKFGIISHHNQLINISRNIITTIDRCIESCYDEEAYIYHNKLLVFQNSEPDNEKRVFITDSNVVVEYLYNEILLGNYYGDYSKYHYTDLAPSGLTYLAGYSYSSQSINTYIDNNPIVSFNIFLPSELYINQLENIVTYYKCPTPLNLIWYPSTNTSFGKTNYNITRNGYLVSEHNNKPFKSNEPIILNINNLPVGNYTYTITISNGYDFTNDEVNVEVQTLSDFNDFPYIQNDGDLQYLESISYSYYINWSIIDENYIEGETKYEIYILKGGIIQNNLTIRGTWTPSPNCKISLNVNDVPISAGYYIFRINVTDGYVCSYSDINVFKQPIEGYYPQEFVKIPEDLTIYKNEVNNYTFEWIIFDDNEIISDEKRVYQLFVGFNGSTPIYNRTGMWKSLEPISVFIGDEFKNIGTYEFYINATNDETMIESHHILLTVKSDLVNIEPYLNPTERINGTRIIYDTEYDNTRILKWNIIDLTTSSYPSYTILFEFDTGIWINWFGKLEEIYGSGTYIANQTELWHRNEICFDVRDFIEIIYQNPYPYDQPINFKLIFYDGFISNGTLMDEFTIIYKQNTPLTPVMIPQYTYEMNKTLIVFNTETSLITFRFVDLTLGSHIYSGSWNNIDSLKENKITYYSLYLNGELIKKDFFQSLHNIHINIDGSNSSWNYLYNYTIEIYDGLGGEFKENFTIIIIENEAPIIHKYFDETYIVFNDAPKSIKICHINDTTIRNPTYKIYENNVPIINTYIWRNDQDIYYSFDYKYQGIYDIKIIFNDGAGLLEEITFTLDVKSHKPYGSYNPLMDFKIYYIFIIIGGIGIAVLMIYIFTKQNKKTIDAYIKKNKYIWDFELMN